ncbi:MAG TPA: transglutaminase domain-containing protein, partial [Sulfurovum sp.]|nr:transglutaminase domain-containing protein [Sulfurovum sp.]
YTLKPDALDTNHSTDSFLFDKRRGYCVHFASSFVTMARMAGIPARVVTGYKSDKSESLNNYLAVKEKDAHAWVELYINKYWTRYETTNTASNIDLGSMSLASAAQNKEEQNPLLKKINLYLMYAKYQVETWILYYSNVRQLQLLEYAKHNPKFVFGFILSFIGLVIVSFIIIAYFRRPRYSSEVLEAIQPIVKILNTKGYIRKENETLHQYFLRYSHENSEKSESITMINKIDHQYEELIYGNNISKLELKHFKTLVKKAVKLKAY